MIRNIIELSNRVVFSIAAAHLTSSSEPSEIEPGANGVSMDVDSGDLTALLQSSRDTVKFLNERIVSCLDYNRISDRRAVHLLAATAEGLGHDVSNLVLSRTTIQRIRTENRKKIADFVKENFHVRCTVNR